MDNKIVFHGSDGMKVWIGTTFHVPITDEYTNFKSFMHSIPDLSDFEAQIARASSDQEKDAIYSRALLDATRYAAPIEACAWTSCDTMVRTGLAWFERQIKEGNQDFLIWHQDYENLKKGIPSVDQLLGYQKSALKWRNETGYGLMRETAILKEKVVANFTVPGIIVANIQDMVKDMIRRRGGALQRKPVSIDHIRCCEEIMNGHFSAIINPSWGEIDKKNSNGHMLLTTGFAKLREKNGPVAVAKLKDAARGFGEWLNSQSIMDKAVGMKAKEAIDRAIEESINLNGGTSVFRNQIAQIDTTFSSYYWLWRSGVNGNSFGSVSDFLFELGQNARGSQKLRRTLDRIGMAWSRPLLMLFADDNFRQERIHMHPAVLTTGRLNEMGICFGIIPATHPDSAVLGSGFAKGILNIRTSGINPAAQVVSKLFDIRRQAKPLADLDVVSSEHLLHQILVGKKSPFQNAFNVEGNATAVNITPYEPPEPSRLPRNTGLSHDAPDSNQMVHIEGLGMIDLSDPKKVQAQINELRMVNEVELLKKKAVAEEKERLKIAKARALERAQAVKEKQSLERLKQLAVQGEEWAKMRDFQGVAQGQGMVAYPVSTPSSGAIPKQPSAHTRTVVLQDQMTMAPNQINPFFGLQHSQQMPMYRMMAPSEETHAGSLLDLEIPEEDVV
nr:N protein [Nairoviridae sp.]